MRTISISKSIRGRGCDDCDIDMNLAVLDRLPAASMRPQHAQATHFALCAVVAQRPVHAAFNVMNCPGFHQVNGTLLRGKRCAGKPHEVLDAEFGGRFQRHKRDPVTIAQMVVIGNHHAIAQAAFLQRGLEVGNSLVTTFGIILVGSYRRRGLASPRLVLARAEVWNLRLAVDHGRHAASDGVVRQLDSLRHFQFLAASLGRRPMAFARATSFNAR